MKQAVKYCSFKQSLVRSETRSIGISCVLFLIIFALFSWASAGDVKDQAARDLERVTIRSAWFSSGTVTLKNGEYREPTVPGSATETVVKLTDKRAFGLVNGKDAAAIVLMTDAGGSGVFYDLVLLEMRPRGWVYADTVLLGDRVKVHSIGIKDNGIIVSMTAHGPSDAMCCPTHEMTRRFTVQADHLVAEHGAQDAGPIGPVWQWIHTRYNDDSMLTRPDDAAGYTLQLRLDGTANIRGDCNRGGGTFTMNGTKLSITITHTTIAACPEGSLEGPFIRDLNRAVGFLLKNDRLFLDLKFDSGTMEFHEKQKM